MRGSRIVSALNWRYAVGEVLLIVIGVSIALAANSWWEDRKAREEELAMLAQLKSALEVDLQEFEAMQKLHLDQERVFATYPNYDEGGEVPDPLEIVVTVTWQDASKRAR